MKNFWLILSVLWLWTCSEGGGDKTTGPEEPPIVVNLTSLGGQAQKGPFNNGTAINVAELTNTLSPTGRNFSSSITDNTGRFAVANVQLESPYVELRANGYYFNEVSNEISSGQLTLFALSNLTGKTSLNVNILTHLEKNRMVALMSGDNPKTFAQAKIQAQEEVLAIFDYSRANVPESELLDISQGGAANAKLLAMSAIIQGDLTVGQMSQLLANMSTDIASDGTLDDTNLRNTLIENSKNLDMAEVRSNLVAHYTSLGISATIPDFETEINQFLKPPVAQDMSASTGEDTTINITLDASDPEGESLTYTILEVNNSTVTLNGNVAIYTPDAHFNGTDTFTFYANDGTSDSNIATVTMTVSAEDDDPNTLDVATTTDEDVAVAVNLSAEEYDGDSYSFAIITDVSNGTTSLNGSTVTYTPNQDFNGEDTFTFEATDDTGRTINVATATITVNPVNDAPTANDVTTSTDENLFSRNNTKIDITYDADNDILFNNNIKGTSSFDSSNSVNITLDGTDVDGDNLTYSVVTINNGSVTINGAIATYEPTQDWNGTDTFTYKVNDGSLDSNTATVTITVNSVNDAPVIIPAANNGTTTMNEDGSMYEQFTVTDVDGDDVTFSIVTNPEHATITNFTNDDPDCPGNCASFTFVPNENWNGTDTFTYKANDGSLDSAIETHTFIVNPVNDAPFAPDITIDMVEDGTGQFIISSAASDANFFRINATDIENDALTFQTISVNNATYVLVDNNNELAYYPNQDFNGQDTFQYTVSDGTDESNTGTITVNIAGVNDAPTTTDIAITMNENRSARMIGIELQGSDVDGDDLTYSVVSDASNGSTDPISSGYLHYFPNDDWNGAETITYKANDGLLDSNTSTITVTVTSVNDAPVVYDSTVTIDEDSFIILNDRGPGKQGQHVFRVSDVDSDLQWPYMEFSWDSTGDGSINFEPYDTGQYTIYTPTKDFNGTTSITYKANDGSLDSNTATVTITVDPVDDLPTAIDFTATTAEDVSVDITLQYEDVDGDVWTNENYAINQEPTNGTITKNGIIATYTPDSGFFGTDSFRYNAGMNGQGPDGDESIWGTVTITVNEVVGTLKVYPDLTSDYNEWFHDIVYDQSTGGFIVAGISLDKNDNGSGGTKEMFHLRTDSSLDASSYETISTTLGGWGDPGDSYSNSAHQFSISERSLSSNYLLSTRSDYLWLVDSSGGVTYKQLSGSLDSTYRWVDYIKQSYPTSDGGFLIFGTTSKSGNFQDRYPVIAKLDASLNVDYFKVLNNHVANTSWSYYAEAQGMVQAADGVYYLVAGTNRTGISNSHAIQFYKVEDSGSALSVTQHVDLSSSIANSPTSFTSSYDIDTMGYLPGTSDSDAEFVIVTDSNTLTRYNIDSSGNAQVKGTFDLNSVRTDYTTHQTYMEIASGNNYLYVVAQSTVGSSSDITVAKLSESLSVLWEKTLDITGLNQEDKLGGVTSIQFGSNSTGIAITGSTQSSSGDWDGFILLLDSDGNRIY